MSEQRADLTADESFFVAMWEFLRPEFEIAMSAWSDPVNVWRRMKSVSPSQARRGIREAVGDLLEMTQDISGAELANIDMFLADRGAPSLTVKRLERKRWLARLLKRGSLESDEEYRALMAKLNDVEDTTLSESQRTLANEMVLRYGVRQQP